MTQRSPTSKLWLIILFKVMFLIFCSAFTVILYTGECTWDKLNSPAADPASVFAIKLITDKGFKALSMTHGDQDEFFDQSADDVTLAWWHTSDPIPHYTANVLTSLSLSRSTGMLVKFQPSTTQQF